MNRGKMIQILLTVPSVVPADPGCVHRAGDRGHRRPHHAALLLLHLLLLHRHLRLHRGKVRRDLCGIIICDITIQIQYRNQITLPMSRKASSIFRNGLSWSWSLPPSSSSSTGMQASNETTAPKSDTTKMVKIRKDTPRVGMMGPLKSAVQKVRFQPNSGGMVGRHVSTILDEEGREVERLCHD